MRIAIDVRPLSQGTQGGISRFGRNLIASLENQDTDHEWVLYGTSSAPADLFPELEFHLVPGNYFRYSLVSLPNALRRDNCDALVSLSTEVLRRTIPTALIVYDLYALNYPSWMPARYKLTRTYWRQIIQARIRVFAIRRLDAAIAISDYTASEIRKHLKGSRVKVSAAYPAADPIFSDLSPSTESREVLFDRLGISPPYFLYVGALNWQKNVRTLLNAFETVRASSIDPVSLVVVGHANWPVDDLRLGERTNVIAIPYLDDAELAILYSHSIAFVYLSLDEGFGLPVLEAMTTGVPVIVSTGGALPEVVGNAGLVVEPDCEEQVREALQTLLTDPTENRRQRVLSVERAHDYDWDRTARTVVTCIVEITSTRKGGTRRHR